MRAIRPKGMRFTKDEQEAVSWYRKAAEQGYARAQYNLGIYYQNGAETDRDLNEVVRYYTLATIQRDQEAEEKH